MRKPKISSIMKALKSENFKQLKERIANLPLEWWQQALNYPRTRKRVTPFLERNYPYVMRNSNLSISDAGKIVSMITEKYKNKALPGPIELLKTSGNLIDHNIYLWVEDQETFKKIRREYDLIPSPEKGKNILFYFKVPNYRFEDESIISREPELGYPWLEWSVSKLNYFRAIWDLSFGDSRIKQAQVELLRRILNEIK